MTKTKVTTNATNKWEMTINPDNKKNAYKKIKMPTGWICPLCGRALSPWTSCCPCFPGRNTYQPPIPPIINPPYTFDASTTYSTMQPIRPQDIVRAHTTATPFSVSSSSTSDEPGTIKWHDMDNGNTIFIGCATDRAPKSYSVETGGVL